MTSTTITRAVAKTIVRIQLEAKPDGLTARDITQRTSLTATAVSLALRDLARHPDRTPVVVYDPPRRVWRLGKRVDALRHQHWSRRWALTYLKSTARMYRSIADPNGDAAAVQHGRTADALDKWIIKIEAGLAELQAEIEIEAAVVEFRTEIDNHGAN